MPREDLLIIDFSYFGDSGLLSIPLSLVLIIIIILFSRVIFILDCFF